MSRPGIANALDTTEVSPRPNDAFSRPMRTATACSSPAISPKSLSSTTCSSMASMHAEDRPGEVLLGADQVRGAGHDEPILPLHARLLGERRGERVQHGRVPPIGARRPRADSDSAASAMVRAAERCR